MCINILIQLLLWTWLLNINNINYINNLGCWSHSFKFKKKLPSKNVIFFDFNDRYFAINSLLDKNYL